MALRFAETGATTLAIDYFGRTAGSGPRPPDFSSESHQADLSRENLLLDVSAALGYLRENLPRPVFAIGFCLGGGTVLHAASAGLPFAGVVAFYAWTGETGRSPALPPEFADTIRCPVLGLFGDADHAVPVEVPQALDERLTGTGIPHEIVIYPGEPHGFFELHHLGEDGHQRANADSWERLLAFLQQGQPGTPTPYPAAPGPPGVSG